MRALVAIALGAVIGCARVEHTSPADAGGEGMDASAHDAGVDAGAIEPRDAGVESDADASNLYAMDSGPGCSSTTRPPCAALDTACTSAEVCADGLDNDCNLLVDDGCPCVPGTVQSCFAGPPGARGVGACSDGTQRCEGALEFGTWGPCTGGISPTAETCDTLDDDCNGCTDEHDCCGTELACPGPDDPRVPSAHPFEEVSVDATTIYTVPGASFRWEVQGGPCESVIPTPTFTTGSLTASTLRFRATLSGDYTVTLHIRAPDGADLTCTFVIHVAGSGLRVELCWRPTTDATSDLDLYLHDPSTMGPWFSMAGVVPVPGIATGSACNWGNCASELRSTLPRADWGYADSPLSACDRGPAGAGWTTLGHCPNPRIDVDGHGYATEPLHGFIENINADDPRDGQTFRVMVHDCFGPASNPVVNVYCGGFLRATVGAAPDIVTLPGGHRCTSDMDTVWRVADVTVHVDGAGTTTDCDVAPIREPGGGAHLTLGDLAY